MKGGIGADPVPEKAAVEETAVASAVEAMARTWMVLLFAANTADTAYWCRQQGGRNLRVRMSHS